MQYILTEEELQELRDKSTKLDEKTTQTLQDLCTKVADNMPVETWKDDKEPWGCILSQDSEWYCDDCPVQKVCPNRFKEWSK